MIDGSTIGVVKIGVPKLEKIDDVPAVFPFAETWMFVIDDGDPAGPAVSGVNGKYELKIGRLADPLGAGKWSLIAWTTLATDAIDMWHVVAQGVHWSSYSKEGGIDLTLLALDSSFNLIPGSPWDVFSQRPMTTSWLHSRAPVPRRAARCRLASAIPVLVSRQS